MTPPTDTGNAALELEKPTMAQLISTTFMLSIGISIAAAVAIVAAGIWLERLN
jgi:hypothetical protein